MQRYQCCTMYENLHQTCEYRSCRHAGTNARSVFASVEYRTASAPSRMSPNTSWLECGHCHFAVTYIFFCAQYVLVAVSTSSINDLQVRESGHTVIVYNNFACFKGPITKRTSLTHRSKGRIIAYLQLLRSKRPSNITLQLLTIQIWTDPTTVTPPTHVVSMVTI